MTDQNPHAPRGAPSESRSRPASEAPASKPSSVPTALAVVSVAVALIGVTAWAEMVVGIQSIYHPFHNRAFLASIPYTPSALGLPIAILFWRVRRRQSRGARLAVWHIVVWAVWLSLACGGCAVAHLVYGFAI